MPPVTSTETQPSAFSTHLKGGGVALALEITPPQKLLPGVLKRRANLLGPGVDVINVIQRPDRLSSLDAAMALQHRGIEAVWHLATRGSSWEALEEQASRARSGGLRHVLCLLGEHAPGSAPAAKSPTVRDSVEMLCRALPSATLGVTYNQYAPEQPKALANLLAKLNAGAAYIQTQPVFDPGAFLQSVQVIRREHPGIPVVPMVLPLLTLDAVDRIQSRLKIAISPAYREAVAAGEEPAWQAFAGVVRELVASNLVNGLAVMTFQMDATLAEGNRIIQALQVAGVRTSPKLPE